jgi:thiol-disulfide isomerase/thioredoxin
MRFFALILLFITSSVLADIRPFTVGSMAAITGERSGRPFILSFWSATCAHCPAELKAIGALRKRYPKLEVVLVATDSPAESALLSEIAKGYGLGDVAQWVFADPQAERLRFEIDRNWYGELPKTYFFDRQHQVESVSGVVPQDRLANWAKANRH